MRRILLASLLALALAVASFGPALAGVGTSPNATPSPNVALK